MAQAMVEKFYYKPIEGGQPYVTIQIVSSQFCSFYLFGGLCMP